LTGLFNQQSGLRDIARFTLIELILVCADLRIHIHLDK